MRPASAPELCVQRSDLIRGLRAWTNGEVLSPLAWNEGIGYHVCCQKVVDVAEGRPSRGRPVALAGLSALLRNPSEFGVGNEDAPADLERFDRSSFDQPGQVSRRNAEKDAAVTKTPRGTGNASGRGSRSVGSMHDAPQRLLTANCGSHNHWRSDR
jgi:hypothetical protein